MAQHTKILTLSNLATTPTSKAMLHEGRRKTRPSSQPSPRRGEGAKSESPPQASTPATPHTTNKTQKPFDASPSPRYTCPPCKKSPTQGTTA
jgi:hypothetical protein